MAILESLLVQLGFTDVQNAGAVQQFGRGLDTVKAKAKEASVEIEKTGKSFNFLGTSLATFAGSLGAGVILNFFDNIGRMLAKIPSEAIRVGSVFEDLNLQLENLEGSSAAAEQSMAWIRDFAKKTPLSVSQTTKAFVRLKSSGLDPTNGSLMALVDTMAGTGKSFDELEGMVRAFSQMQGKQKISAEEMEQLSERGVNAWQALADSLGKTVPQVRDLVKKGDLGQDAIQGLIKTLGSKNLGAAAKAAKTYSGILGRLGDAWEDFFLRISSKGIFEVVKKQVVDLLNLYEKWEADGTIDAIATKISDFMVSIVNMGRSVIPVLQSVIRITGRFGTAFTAISPYIQDFLGQMGGVEHILGQVATALLLPLKVIDDFLAYKQGQRSIIGMFLAQTPELTKTFGEIGQSFENLKTSWADFIKTKPVQDFITDVKTLGTEISNLFTPRAEGQTWLQQTLTDFAKDVKKLMDELTELVKFASDPWGYLAQKRKEKLEKDEAEKKRKQAVEDAAAQERKDSSHRQQSESQLETRKILPTISGDIGGDVLSLPQVAPVPQETPAEKTLRERREADYARNQEADRKAQAEIDDLKEKKRKIDEEINRQDISKLPEIKPYDLGIIPDLPDLKFWSTPPVEPPPPAAPIAPYDARTRRLKRMGLPVPPPPDSTPDDKIEGESKQDKVSGGAGSDIIGALTRGFDESEAARGTRVVGAQTASLDTGTISDANSQTVGVPKDTDPTKLERMGEAIGEGIDADKLGEAIAEAITRYLGGGAGFAGNAAVGFAKAVTSALGSMAPGGAGGAPGGPGGGPDGPSAGPVSAKEGERIAVAKAAMEDQLRKEGVPEANIKEAANLLAGQAMAESRLTPTTSHDKGTGYGIYGARDPGGLGTGGRASNMFKWLKDHGYAKDSLEGQSRYMAHEAMTGGYGGSRAALMGATAGNRAQGVRTLIEDFEKPSDQGAGQNATRLGFTTQAAGVAANADAFRQVGGGVGAGGGPDVSDVYKTGKAEAEAAGLHVTSSYRPPGHDLSKENPTSLHPKGRAWDVRAQNAGAAQIAMSKQREIFARRGLVEGRDYRIDDETGNKGPRHKTGPHVHVQMTEEGAERYKAAATGGAPRATQGPIAPTLTTMPPPSSVTGQIGKDQKKTIIGGNKQSSLNVNAPITVHAQGEVVPEVISNKLSKTMAMAHNRASDLASFNPYPDQPAAQGLGETSLFGEGGSATT